MIQSGESRITSFNNSSLTDVQPQQKLPVETSLDQQTETVPPLLTKTHLTQQTPNVRIIFSSTSASDTLLDTVSLLADSIPDPCN